MRKYTIIGHTGFIGSYLMNSINVTFQYNSKNISEITHNEHDIIICCAPSATKWQVNKEPQQDIDNINNLIDIISKIKCNKFILISTIDVYNNLDSSDESTLIDHYKNHHYGRNRFYMESRCSEIFSDKLSIVRLCGLYGFGLKKNIIFDFINDRLESIDTESEFQWYNVDYLKSDIEYVIENNIKLINLFSEPISNLELIDIFSEFKTVNNIKLNKSSNIKYNCKTIHSKTGYWIQKESIINNLRNYLSIMINSSNIIVSNLCWKENIDKDILKKYNINSIEVSPTKHFGDDFINQDLSYFEKFKLDNIYSFQSIFFGTKFTIVDNYNEVLNYLKKLITISEYLSVKKLVFGSPSVRIVRTEEDKKIIFKFFKEVSEYLKGKDVVVCLEPNAKQYNCNFLIDSKETSRFVRELKSDNIKLMLDTGCMFLENEDILSAISNNIDIIQHFHLSVPFLKSLHDFSEIKFKMILNKLSELNYSYKITIEMLNRSCFEIDSTLHEIFRTSKIAIIGAGWYGCHIADKFIQKGIFPKIIDKKNIFCGSSSNNQNRLHLGFHYPRSFNTRNLCKNNFHKFEEQYSRFTSDVKNNIYLISKDSIIDFETYKQIMKSSGLNFDEINVNDFEVLNIDGGILCKEKFIDHKKVKKYFESKLKRHLSIKKIENPLEISNQFDIVIDVTNNSFNLAKKDGKNLYHENTISLIYKREKNDIIAYTVMDGKFFSLYPYDLENNYYTLTDVELTPIDKYLNTSFENFNPDKEWIEKTIFNFERKVSSFLPSFKKDYTFVDYFISRKNKFDFKSDSRELVYSENGNVISFTCGKITGIFECEEILKKIKII